MLNLKNVSKTFADQTKALDQVSLNIKQGEFVALLGPNGAGKSTLINVLAGNVQKDSGGVKIGGFDLDKNALGTKKIIGIVPQEIAYDFTFTVNEVLNHQSGYFGIWNNQEYIDHLLKELSLFDKKHTRSRELSGGMQRRLLIAKALVHKPKLLILDEPTAGVDIELRRSLYDFLDRLFADGVTIILTTHYLEEAEKLCDRIIMINDGKIIDDQPKAQLMNTSKNENILEFSFEQEITLDQFTFFSDYQPEIQRHTKLLLTVNKDELGTVFQIIKENGIVFHDVKIEQPKLEDIFYKMIHQTKN